MNNDVRQTLAELVRKHGPGLADDRAKLRGLLRDLCHGPDAGVQIRWIATAAEEGVPQALQAGTSPVSAETRLAQTVQRFEHTVGVQGGLARWAVESWATALGVVTPASLAVPATGASPQTAAPDDPFAVPARLEPEQELRAAIRQALSDGVVTEQERTWLQSERERLGLSSAVASRLFAEEKARVAEAAAQARAAAERLAPTPREGYAWTVPELGMEFVYVAPGSFQMGSNDGFCSAKPVHAVRISRGFWLGTYEVIQAEYEAVVGTNPSNFKGARNPVERVSWNNARAFCAKLTARERAGGRLPSGYEYRLPTEAEWEYAARGGPASKGHTYAGSNTVDEVAWYDPNSGHTTHPVGEKRPNELGLYDMSGNVGEWCLDWYDIEYYGRSPNTDPANTQATTFRVGRGGCWGAAPERVRSAVRDAHVPGDTSYFLGFRACLAPRLFAEEKTRTTEEAAQPQEAGTDALESPHIRDAGEQNNLGVCYLNGEGVTKNAQEAVRWFRRAAEQGDANAQRNLGICYANGSGVTKDEQEAVRWYREAAGAGLALAQGSLGECYRDGTGVPQDGQKAVRWFLRAAEQGDVTAQLNLGICYANGEGVTKNEQEAVRWYRKAAKAGLAFAQGVLGECYANGSGVTKNEQEAVGWYRKAAVQGQAGAQYSLGVCYAKGRGVDKDEQEAVRWYRKAAEQGYASAQYLLGLCYANGTGVAKDEQEASMWYRKAAEQGQVDAQYNLAVRYALGVGVAKDEQEAARWCRKAAEQGDAGAQRGLAVCYMKGRGVAKDEREAVRWCRKAAEQGDAGAQYILGLSHANGTGVAKDEQEAVRWYRKAAEQGDASAQFYLGECYENGTGITKSEQEAVAWYGKAAAQGDVDAKEALGRMGRK